ncbi:hypothetical protein SAMN02927937_00158 [Paenimyroides aquimaris]|uniref:Uncharacterized protein n=1 Tax=Paenimyroides marinum TaxID=1159016 RepID=A0A1H6IZG9_9FLAO|nr:hypothetical protein [Paenimyroides aquimaris]SEH55118.1 hypothetical protein SAMN02927937_00158 [Paenimyroides aquimaris]
MKKLIVILALFMLIKPIIPVLEYVVFYDYIKNELCINKDRPELKCNGKCHLMKELAKASATQDKSTSHNFSVESNIVFYQDFQCFNFTFFSNINKRIYNFHYNNLYNHSYYKVLIKPPVYLS